MQRVQAFWQGQVMVEYASAAVTAEFAHWLLQLGAPPELIRQALRIAQDEVDHADLCYAVATEAGCVGAIAQDKVSLRFPHTHADLRKNLCAALLDFYCLGETAAVPLFAAMRKYTGQASALHAYQRIVQDEPRHASFGWLTLAWADDAWAETRVWLHELLPAALQRMASQYACQEELASPLTDAEHHWGMLPRLQYTTVFEETILTLYAKHLKYYDIDVFAVWETVKKRSQED